MKFCNTCKSEKESSAFHRLLRRGVERLQSKCKECHKQWKSHNRDKINETHRKWHWENRERSNSRSKNYWRRKVERTPKWLSLGDKIEMAWAKKLAIQRTKETGIKYEVDHIIPLCGDLASGLNVPWNLQIIRASENKKKANKVEVRNVA